MSGLDGAGLAFPVMVGLGILVVIIFVSGWAFGQ